MADARKLLAQLPPEGFTGAKNSDEQRMTAPRQPIWEHVATVASAAGEGSDEQVKASPPKLVRREKKPSLGCGDNREDALRSEYIQLPQLERMLNSGQIRAKSDTEPERFPPRRIHDSPKRREPLERRTVLPPYPDHFDSGTIDYPLTQNDPIESQKGPWNALIGLNEGREEAKGPSFTDSGYSTLEETLARLDQEKTLLAERQQKSFSVHKTQGSIGPSDEARTSSDFSSRGITASTQDKRLMPTAEVKATESSSKEFQTDSKTGTSPVSDFPSSQNLEKPWHRGSSGSDRGSIGSDIGSTESNKPTLGAIKTGYVPVKSREDRKQERTMFDSSKLEDIRLLSTAILEYLQSRSTEDQLSEEPLKEESNYTIFKNAEVDPPPLPQKKHRVLPSPVKVGQAVRSSGPFSVDAGFPLELDDVQASTLVPHLAEPTHMNWDEVLREARMLGIPLSRSSSRCRSSSDRRSSMSSSAASSDISHQSSPCSSPIRTSKRKNAKEERPGKERDQKHSNSNKMNIFSLQRWLSKLKRSDRSSSKDSASNTSNRRQHLSCSSERNNPAAATLPQPQRRSLSASATHRNRINLGTDSCTCNPTEHVSSSSSNKSPSYRPTSSLTYDISASGSRGSSNSFLSTSMVASPSSSSLGSVFSRSSRGSGSTPLMLSTTPRDRGMNLHGSPLSSSVSPATQAGGQRTPATLGIAQTQSRRISKSPTRYSRNLDLMKTIDQLKDCGWYWGSLGWEEARMKLEPTYDGSFLLRDSSDDRYLFSLSFRSQGKVHHTRIEHYKGTFNFSSQPPSLASASIVELIDRAVAYSQTHPYVSCLQPRPPGLNPIPIQLLYPVLRPTLLPSLQQLCRAAIVSIVRIDDIDRLPITDRLKNYVRISQQV